MERGVYVLGMHRSGTSAVTRLVNLLGVATCVADDLLGATPDNPRGHWESASLAALNDRVLEAIGCDWTCPPRPESGWALDPSLEGLRSEAAAQVGRVLTTAQWVWKDPRNCVTFPFWRASVSAPPVVVLVDRNPLEIADSLTARDGFSRSFGVALWERYLRLCLDAIEGLPVLVTSFGALLEDPTGWRTEARSFLGVNGIATSDETERDMHAFLDVGLRHQRLRDDRVAGDASLSQAQRELADRLAMLRGVHRMLPAHGLGEETPTTDALLAERRSARSTELELRAQYDELEGYARALAERVLLLETTPTPRDG